MISEKDSLLLWTEVYDGIPNGSNCIDYGWAVFPKNMSIYEARDKAVQRFKTKPKHIVMTYTTDRCARRFKASDYILGIFA